MVAAAILNNRNIAISKQLLDWSSQNLALWRTLTLLTLPSVKNFKFMKIENPAWRHVEMFMVVAKIRT